MSQYKRAAKFLLKLLNLKMVTVKLFRNAGKLSVFDEA
jgi:hypothetical protein